MLEVGFGDNWSMQSRNRIVLPIVFEMRWMCEKWPTVDDPVSSFILRSNPRRYGKPEVIVTGPNKVVDVGLNHVLDIMSGRFLSSGWTASSMYYASWAAYIGVGDSSVAASSSQTDLQASSNKIRAIMNSSYPTAASSNSNQFQADFGAGVANFAWEERGLFNASSGQKMFARHVSSMGTKSGGTWTLTCTLTAASST